MPEFMPEFQGGSYNSWGGPEGGCADNTGADFANLFYRWNIGQRVTAMSLYMLFGGTNWGAIAAPVTASSYDYSALISEDRSIGSKFYETKLLALFTRCARDLTMTELVGNGTQYTDNSAVRAYELRNPETNAGFYATFHTNTSLSTNEKFHLKVNTSAGELTIPRHGGKIRLNGHQSKIVVTDFVFGSHTLLYSTAEVLTYDGFDDIPTLVLWVPTGESGEFSVRAAKHGTSQPHLILHQRHRHDKTTGALNPRGILDFKLLGSSTSFSHWRLAGTADGESNLDPVRGVYNGDGLYGERVGWHLPGFDDSTWTSASKQQTVVNGLTSSVLSFQGATVRFFRTVIPLQLSSSHEISISFILSTPTCSTTSYRAQLFVNGYQS
ncbi:hypothetical protein PENDEC_c036G00600 [Penicillium decumbens]|uniref:beta-galactosidase n=1 Tax=Penicillium decumbens TaxID=69771 RepID=A0A1V6NUI4_PENDC|nr:hypothetical protein PENDEC_c036G00600 [Penicillium decumbens]